MSPIEISLVVLAYILGSFSSAVIVCRLMKLPDPRTLGSKNPGATNVLRHGGKKAAFLTLCFDVLKGIIAVLIARSVTNEPLVLASVTFVVFIGHLYPIFFGFRGGKGVATSFGGLVVLVWPVGLSTLAVWLTIAFVFGYSSLAALVAAFLSPMLMYWFSGEPYYILTSFLMSSLLIWRHRSNIRDLIHGKEDKISDE